MSDDAVPDDVRPVLLAALAVEVEGAEVLGDATGVEILDDYIDAHYVRVGRYGDYLLLKRR